ncbi:MAG: hypothetical protein ACE5WD_04575 [Candidatus Aminicenantia bacterium]
MSKENSFQDYTPEITTIAKGAGVVFLGTTVGTGLKYIFELTVARNLGPKLFSVFTLKTMNMS